VGLERKDEKKRKKEKKKKKRPELAVHPS